MRSYTAICTGILMLLAACDGAPAILAPDYAQPKTRPARNFTSFDQPLRCMDALLEKAGRRQVRLSSTGIPDRTRKINVGGDDMLINALNRMTRRSQAYVFLDQGLVKESGIIDLHVVAAKRPPRPSHYIRGSISQLDHEVGTDGVSIDLLQERLPVATGEDAPLGDPYTGDISNNRSLSVVTVDLHLVEFPSRRVVPGASVSNSMVVRARSRGFGSYGLINLTNTTISVQVERIESAGQAVRNLIEVSLIELIGRHSGVPYWHCLSAPETDAKANSTSEHVFTYTPDAATISEAQEILIRLGHLDGDVTGTIDGKTRAAIAAFQAQENVLVNGIVDFDTITRLRRWISAANATTGPTSASGNSVKEGRSHDQNFVPIDTFLSGTRN